MRWSWKTVGVGGVLLVVLSFGAYLFMPLSRSLPRDYSQVILARDSTFLRVFLNESQQWCLPPSMSPVVPDKLKKAVLTYEDQYFYQHPGVNPFALIRATYLNIKHRRVVSGGSTLTMQLSRMIYDEERTLYQKVLEIMLAMKLEIHFSKEEILTEYLSHAPYGSNIRGYTAASYRYFDKKPDQLSWAEAALLAVLPNAPGMIFPGKNQQELKAKRDGLLSKLLEKQLIDQETYQLSLLERVPDKIVPFPLAAPHLTERIHQENQLSVIYTTIDQNIQYETNFFVKQHAAQMRQMGVMNACALVVDNVTGEVVSYVGSQDFDDLDANGRVDGIVAARSSGSILKPYLYALAIDEGLILPQTLIKDVPTYFNSFSPNNASEKFAGVVPASQALIHSLNVPAVRLLNAYGVDKFYNMLEAAGISTLFRESEEYGLPLILGGSEVTPWDMAKLYRGMANEGQFGDITYQINQRSGYKKALLSSGASYLVLEEMKELIRPGLEFFWKKYGNQRPVAWKTGTSYGHKDAWAVGTTPKWTVIVWVGNFDGQSNKSLSGMRSAGPLLFNIINVLPVPEDGDWFAPDPKDFVVVKLCKQTGFYASEHCREPVDAEAPVNMKPIGICSYHQSVPIEGSHTVCSHCWSGRQVQQSFLNYPPDVSYYLRQNGGITASTPSHKPECPVRQEQDVLQIIYPLGGANIFVTKDFDGTSQPVVSRVATRFPDREIYWYLDDQYLGSTIQQPSFPLKLQAGTHYLTVVDMEGNRDKIRFSVVEN